MVKNYGQSGVAAKVQLGKNGIEIADESGIFAVRKNGSLVRIQASAPTVSADVVTKGHFDTALATLTGGIGFTGTYSPNTFAHYINSATSLKNADDLLDAALFEFETDLNGFASKVGIDGSGNLVIPASTYLAGSTSVMNAASKLDVALKGVADDVGRIKTAAGLNSNGSFSAHTGTRYINAATTIKGVDVILDATIGGIDDRVVAIGNSVGLVGTALPNLSSTNYLGSATSVMNAVTVLDSQLKTISNSLTDIDKVFVYKGTVAGGATSGAAVSLTGRNPTTGYYLRVSTSGYFSHNGGAAFFANAGDGLVFNNAGTWDIVDNTNSTISGTANRVTITGTPDTGYSVDISSAYVGQTSITTLGTIGTGTWQGTAIAADRGGTGQTTFAVGDLLIGGASNTLTKLSKGAANTVLQMNASATTAAWTVLDTANMVHSGSNLATQLNQFGSSLTGLNAGTGLGGGGTYTVDATTNYLKTATSLKDADKKLDAALYTLSQQITSMVSDEIKSPSNEYSVKTTATAIEVQGPTGNGKQAFLKFVSEVGGTTAYSAATIKGKENAVEIEVRKGASPAVLEIDASSVDLGGSQIKNLGNATLPTDALNLNQARSTFATIQVVTLSEGTTAISTGSIKGIITRVTVKITSAFATGSLPTMGVAGTTDLIFSDADIDSTVVGTYVVDMATSVNAATFWYNGTSGTGAATVLIEYIAQP